MKTHPRSPRIRELEVELEQVNREAAPTELEVGNLERRKLKEAYTLLLDATFETSERMAIIAGFGGYILGQLDDSPVPAGSTKPKYAGEFENENLIDMVYLIFLTVLLLYCLFPVRYLLLLEHSLLPI